MSGKRFPDFGEHFPIPENAGVFATHRVISDISTNLSVFGISAILRRTGRLGTKAFPSGRKTLRMAGQRFPIPGSVFLVSENVADFATQRDISDIPENLSL